MQVNATASTGAQNTGAQFDAQMGDAGAEFINNLPPNIFTEAVREERKSATGRPDQGKNPFGTSLADTADAEPFPSEQESQEQTDNEKKPPAKIRLGELGEFDETELTKTISDLQELRRGAYKAFQEASQLRKETVAEKQRLQEFAQQAKKNPAYITQLLNGLGLDGRAYAEHELARQFDERTMSPQEIEHQRLIEERNALMEKVQAQEKAQEEQAFERETSQYEQYFLQEFTNVLQKSGIPADMYTVARMADLINRNIADGVQGVQLHHLGQLAFHEVKDQHRRIQSKLDDRGFAEYLGEKGLQRAAKILADRAAKKQASFFNNKPAQPSPAFPQVTNSNGYLGMREYEDMRKKGLI